MKDRLEAESEPAYFEGVVGLDALGDHPDSFPIFFGEHGIVEGQQGRALKNSEMKAKMHQ